MPISPTDMLCFALHSTAHAVHGAYGPLLQPLGLTYPQYLVLTSLAARDNQTVRQIGADLRLESNTLTPLLKRMQGFGWLTRRRDPDDERQVRLSLTGVGRDLAERAALVHRSFAEKTGIPLADLDDLRDILIALRERLKPTKPGARLPTP
jgi:DNA-binding MarR family transcriptional regulator